jgi:hypothetical protein
MYSKCPVRIVTVYTLAMYVYVLAHIGGGLVQHSTINHLECYVYILVKGPHSRATVKALRIGSYDTHD